MLKNYFKIGVRNFLKHKSFSIINVSGLAAGMACIIFIFLWVGDELSYDTFHKDADNLYRIVYFNDSEKQVTTHSALADALKRDIPEIITTSRIMQGSRLSIQYISEKETTERKLYYEDGIIMAESSLFEIFQYKVLKGDINNSLIEPLTMVITESTAKKYFGNEDPIGKMLKINDRINMQVTAVVENPPHNTHLKYNMIIPLTFMQMMGQNLESWDSTRYLTYLKLRDDANHNIVFDKVENIVSKYKDENTFKVMMQPVTDIYLKSDFNFDIAGLGDIKYTYIFSLTAFLILLIACINFVNLSTAKFIPRSKEVGLRKIVGARKSQIIFQYLSESLIVCVIALIIAILIAKVLLPEFNSFTGKDLSFSLFDFQILSGLLLILTMVGIMGGLYPAIFVSSFNPINILKGNMNFSKKSKGLTNNAVKKVLVIMQFTVSVILIIGSTVIYNQLDFIKSMKLGFDKDNIIFMPVNTIGNKFDLIKEELTKFSDIKGLAVSEYLTTQTGKETENISWENKDETKELKVKYKAIGYEYISLLGLKIKEGRSFSKNFPNDTSNSYIVNEEFIIQSEMKDPIGKNLTLNGRPGKIVGVIKNAYYRSLHAKVEPQVHNLLFDLTDHDATLNGVIYIKISGRNIPDTIDKIVTTWNKLAPSTPAEYFFLDEEYEKLYKSEQLMGDLSFYFTLLGIIVASLGLYGLTAYIIEQRKKEICIRKVLGASQSGILIQLSKEFFTWVGISLLIGWPIAYIAMTSWLENFAYSINIGIFVFLFSGIIVLIIASAALSYHVVKASKANPVNGLRYE